MALRLDVTPIGAFSDMYDGGQGIVIYTFNKSQNGIDFPEVYIPVDGRPRVKLAKEGGKIVYLDDEYTIDTEHTETFYNGRRVPFVYTPGQGITMYLYATPQLGQVNSYEGTIVWKRSGTSITPTPPPGEPNTPLYCLELEAPVNVIDYYNRYQSVITPRIMTITEFSGWRIVQVDLTANTIRVYMQEVGSLPLAVVIGLIVAAIAAIVGLAVGYWSYNWRLVNVERNESVQQGTQSKENNLTKLAELIAEVEKAGGDASDLKEAYKILAGQEPEVPGNTEAGSMDWKTIALFGVAAIALSGEKW